MTDCVICGGPDPHDFHYVCDCGGALEPHQPRGYAPCHEMGSCEMYEAYSKGWAACFGIIGMATAIGERQCFCGACGLFLTDCECPIVFMSLQPSSDEGTKR